MKRFIIFFSIALLCSAITFFLYLQQFNFLKSIDLKLRDVRFKVRKQIDSDKRVVIAAIDSKSINELGRFPWDRKLIAKLIDNLKYYGAKTVAFDVIFSESSNPESDKILSDSIKKAGNVILGYFFREEKEAPSYESLEILEEKAAIRKIHVGQGAKNIPVVNLPYVEVNIPCLAKSAQSFGFFNIFADRDGIIRNATLLSLFDGNLYPSLPLEALSKYFQKELSVSVEEYGIDSIKIDGEIIPSNEAGQFALNYYGGYNAFNQISAVDIIKKRVNSNILKNSLVFVGATEIGISDVRATPVNPVLPGVEIHATVVSNFFQKFFLIRNSVVVFTESLFIFIFALLLGSFLGVFKKTFYSLVTLVVMLALYGFINMLLFKELFFNLSIIYPFISMSLTYFTSEAYRNFVEERQSRFLKKAFSSYVSDKLVGQIIENPDLLKLGGEKKYITMLFSDIRGFTTLSEQVTPEQLVELLNEYFTPMTNIVLKNNGTLDKYIGDAIMALFNVPVNVEEHEYFGCLTALEMIESLDKLNNDFKKKGFPAIDIGIGLNTGYAVVGNMGTDTRFDYTAIGDSVNLASRLEGTNKFFGTRIIVSEFTYEKVKDRFKFRMLDKIRVKGKVEGITIYELNNNLSAALINEFNIALEYYFKKNFYKASEIFKELFEKFNDKASKVLSERCDYYISQPPPESWDGVFVMTSK
jgi:adenylate cyclase